MAGLSMVQILFGALSPRFGASVILFPFQGLMLWARDGGVRVKILRYRFGLVNKIMMS